MARIVDFGSGDRRLRLGNEEYGRTFNFGTAWQRIRITVHVVVEPGLGGYASAGLLFGVCQGTSAMWRSDSCTDFIGATFGTVVPPSTETWVANAGPPPRYSRPVGSGSASWVRKQNTTITGGAATLTTNTLYYSADNTVRSPFVMDIEKFTGYVTIYTGSPNTPTEQSEANLLRHAYNETLTGSVPGLPALVNTKIACSGPMLWDTVNIVWTLDRPYIDICKLLVARAR